jgi:hypothetical protein
MFEKCIYKEGDTELRTILKDDLSCPYTGRKAEDIIAELGEEYKVMDFDDAFPMIEKAENERYITDWKEIDEEIWEDNLGVLPPEKWERVLDVEIFRMSEYWTSNITCHYAKYKNRYFSCKRRTSCNYADLAEEVKKLVD